jgi:hypothetical protein
MLVAPSWWAVVTRTRGNTTYLGCKSGYVLAHAVTARSAPAAVRLDSVDSTTSTARRGQPRA